MDRRTEKQECDTQSLTPDNHLYLPFRISKEEAVRKMVRFMKKEDPEDKSGIARSISEARIQSKLIPLAVVDAKSHARLLGTSEIELGSHISRYDHGDGKTERGPEVCTVKRWQTERIFDLEVDDMIINLNIKQSRKTKSLTNMLDNQNIVNAVMPFDFDRAEEWKEDAIKDLTIETIDYDDTQIDQIIEERIKDIARYSMLETIAEYDRGTFWNTQQLKIEEKEIKYIYCPVYIFPIDSGTLKRYIVVNGRNGKTIGNPAIATKETFKYTIGMITGLVILSLVMSVFVHPGAFIFFSIFGIPAILVYASFETKNFLKIDIRYRHEKETKHKVTNLQKSDKDLGTFYNQPMYFHSNCESVNS